MNFCESFLVVAVMVKSLWLLWFLLSIELLLFFALPVEW